MAYDSKQDTVMHIVRVQELMADICERLALRAELHDASKLAEPEKSAFDAHAPQRSRCIYGSEKYNGHLDELHAALAHHYAHNSHHPEHYRDGVNGMSLLDLLEMFCDWKAASEKHRNGSLARSIKINRERFGLSEQLLNIFENTRRELKW
ncbi:MAG: DUF5662 family protein [candidate division KSB1 bacterium]|nr:DUF5662 family protein [candidate division KSB1 bacterium]MDZ7364740.1 DUF5662 family protein [candidate division KSB1 bacterium]MDZ7402512.1 DUF5662 family protein [candidate division KSB1 bacterium]